ncbi:MAG: hypothetical protein NVV62_16820 [Terricaulis sp.]|nr:hypothetical protein [Terricaulis sp.]
MLEAKDLRKVYNGYEALKGLNISVGAGEIYCLLGANGRQNHDDQSVPEFHRSHQREREGGRALGG